MIQRIITANPYRVLAWTVCILLSLFIILEGWRYTVRPSEANQKVAVQQSLNTAQELFEKQKNKLKEESTDLADALKSHIQQRHSKKTLYNALDRYHQFWGSSLYRNNDPVVWYGFTPEDLTVDPEAEEDRAYISIEKDNNVLYWLCKVRFVIQDQTDFIPYYLFTSSRIEQTNVLNIGKTSEFNLITNNFDKRSYPVQFSLFDPPPEKMLDYRVISTTQNDSVGVIYALPGEFGETMRSWNLTTWRWHSAFAVLCFIIISFLLYFWVDRFRNWQSLTLQLIIIGVSWVVLVYGSNIIGWASSLVLGPNEKAEAIYAVRSVTAYGLNGVFMFLVALTISRDIIREAVTFKSSSYLSTILVAVLKGPANLIPVLVVLYNAYLIGSSINIQLFDLQVFPDTVTILLYLSVALALLSVGIVLVAINQFLLRCCKSQFKLVAFLASSSFVVSLVASQLYLPESFTMNWSSLVSLVYFGGIYSTAFFRFSYPGYIRHISPIRSIAIGSLLLSLVASPVLYEGYKVQRDRQLLQVAQNFSAAEDTDAKETTGRILTELQKKFSDVTDEDLTKRVPFLQSEFTRTIEQIITPRIQNFSLDLQLIRPGGKLIASYATDLNSPDWVNVYDIPRLSAPLEIERITKNTNRPIVQVPLELQNQEDYQTFYRGWIPIFGKNEKPIAWILCSVYKERPDFNKPIRAVMASLTYEDWSNSYLVQHYKKGELSGTIQQGVQGYFPTYNELKTVEKKALREDSLIYFNSENAEHTYRNMLWKRSPESVIKSSSIDPDIKNILFSFFRLNFTLMVAGCVISLILFLLGYSSYRLIGRNERFQYRILDSFLLATLIFLGFLVISTHYAIKSQNEVIVRQELLGQLESLTNAIERTPVFRESFSVRSIFSLDSLVTPMNVDASFYAGREIAESTTPQIYQQHLLPNTIPQPVYYSLFEEQVRTSITNVTLASQELMIGYRSVLSPNRNPVAAVAIPTFIQSPKYNQQLLETTSYLIILYLMVFGLFILGTTIISRQITKPLSFIQRGLNKISEGNLNTTIPVRSDDEIGSLASAYNQMVYRLKQLQKELAVAEREAAWKEMAQQVAHEIKNPLTPMKLNVQHLKRQIASNDIEFKELKPKIDRITENLIQQIQSLNNIASEFSKFSKPISREFISVDINKVIRSVTDLYQHDERVSITSYLHPYPVIVSGLEDELRRVTINLVKNAYEAMSGEGTITLRSYIKKQSAFIEIEDDGEGIEEEDKAKIFVPNFSTKSSGTGLGLAICKKITEAHGGSISFASIKGNGTTFIIKLPLEKQSGDHLHQS